MRYRLKRIPALRAARTVAVAYAMLGFVGVVVEAALRPAPLVELATLAVGILVGSAALGFFSALCLCWAYNASASCTHGIELELVDSADG